MKQITNKEYEEWQKYKAEKAKGHVLLPDTVRFICEANGYDAEKIGQHFLEILPKIERNSDLSVCKSFPLAPCAVLGNGSGLLLCQRGHNREQQLALAIEGPDVFFLKIALHIVFLQGSDGGKAVNRVSGKPADRLRDDQVDLPGEGIGYHAFEALTLFGVRPGDALVGIDTGELPIVPSLDVVGVVIDLRFIAGQLFFVVCADTSVGRHTSLLCAVDKEYVEFLIGRDGEFDQIVAFTVRRAKRDLRDDNSELVWVLAYPKAEYTDNADSFDEYYDRVEISDEAARSHPKAAIQVRNRSMVDRSDLVVCYVEHETGGAFQTKAYAEKSGKTVINLAAD